MVATPDFTASGNMIFGKNSDREPNEAQALLRVPRQEHTAATVSTTFIDVPQVQETNEVLLSKPFHMWGAEMGANEHGVVIGNEAVFTRIPFEKKNLGLTGMDMLRLALERSGTAMQALETITDLVRQYSQDACGGYTDRKFFYHNSFIIADASEAFVLETAGHQWAAIRVKGFRSISNGLTIEGEFDFSSPDLIDFARKQGWLKAGEDFSFRRCYSDRFMTYFSQCRFRQARSMERGTRGRGSLDSGGMMDILRDHGGVERENFDPARSGMKSLSLFASGITAPSQTTGSLVAELRNKKPSTYWFTGTAAPCLSTFKPCFMPGQGLRLENFAQPGPVPDRSLWWRHEMLHRLTLRNYPELSALFVTERDALEEQFRKEETRLISSGEGSAELDRFSERCFEAADTALERWTQSVRQARVSTYGLHPFYRLFRKRIDRAAGLRIG